MKRILVMAAIALLVIPTADAQKKVSVVTTLPDLAWIAETVGGDRVDAFAIATGYQDPHFVDPKPSYIVKLSRADMFVTVGLDLEAGWVPPLLNSARNDKILKGAPGYVDASVNIPLLEVPTSVSREQGDIHAYGNPHYWMDPENGKIIARNIRDGLVRLRPQDAAYFDANLQKFETELSEHIKGWEEKMSPFKNTKVIAYHNQWPYFEQHIGLDIVDFLEPKPGIPPTPSQLAKIIGLMKAQDIHVIIIAPYYRPDSAELVARRTDAQVVTLASSVGAFKDIKSYYDLFDYNVDHLIQAFSKAQ
ncbi:MAG: zinc ABC transporter substrate-binding protein [Bacteroidetes bacterium]|nr:zinc ABC transporter substrate-binding protein [Bacteroidota bacterium]